MSAKIHLVNISTDKTEESKAANKLKELIAASIPKDTSGNIYIASNLTLCGQEVRDIDIAIWGCLNNCVLSNYYSSGEQYTKKDLEVLDFCVAVELKGMSINDISFLVTHFYYDYGKGPKDLTSQNEKQRYSLMNYLENYCGVKAWVTNTIWFKAVSPRELSLKTGDCLVGALPGVFSFSDLIGVIISQCQKPRFDRESDTYILSSGISENDIEQIKQNLLIDRPVPSELTRNKLELITQQVAERIVDQSTRGDSLVTYTGKAGTGKTLILLQTALQLAENNGNRCMLLTYNHALVSDVRRLLHFLNVPDGVDSNTIQIKTLHSFFMELMNALGIQTNSISGKCFDSEYARCLKELNTYITELMDANDIKVLRDDHQLAIDWDYILVDEAQDWSPQEKDILFKVYGKDRIIVADGGQQFIRSNNHLDWGGKKEQLKINRRQKSNLVTFVNAVANEMDVQWSQKGDDRLIGGKVIIKKQFTDGDYENLTSYCKQCKCDNYDLLFLVPPQMVITDDSGNTCFKNKAKWEQANCLFFDGTNNRLRGQYPVRVEECRMFQYESCRGLEGWCVVCLQFDELLNWKTESFDENRHADSTVLDSRNEKLKKYLWMWTMLPFTRAIDTLIITLKNPDSEIGQKLKRISQRLSDFVIWDLN